MAIAHQTESNEQAQQSSAHEWIRHHYSVMTDWSLLIKAMDCQM